MLATGFPELPDIARAVSAGIFSFILKPWQLSYLEGEMDKAWRFHAIQQQNRRYLAMLEDELRWGGALQRALLRIEPPPACGATFEASYIPLEDLHCGGDFYDLIPLPRGRFVCLVGDVCGHGIKAAFVTTVLKAMLRERFAGDEIASPATLLSWLNRRVCGILPEMPDLLVTFAACLLETRESRVVYAGAGHPSPCVVRGEEVIRLQAPGASLGFDPTAVYGELSLPLRPADRLVLYTDGLVELERGVGSVPEDRLSEALTAAAKAASFNDALVERMRALAPTGRFIDDVAILSARLP
jgi:sigma-B regulation protein RsbU (phosphoserine phosphatase)